MQSKVRGLTITKFILQKIAMLILISGLLQVERMNNLYDEVEISKFDERLWLYFYPVASLSFLKDVPDQRCICNFFQPFQKA